MRGAKFANDTKIDNLKVQVEYQFSGTLCSRAFVHYLVFWTIGDHMTTKRHYTYGPLVTPHPGP